MSIRVMSKVWDEGPEDKAEILVLIALADFCNDDGECWPSVGAIARKARMSIRGVQTVMARLSDMGWLEIDHSAGRKGCNLYRVHPPHPVHPRTECTPHPVHPPPHPVPFTPAPGAPEPSITIIEPSSNKISDVSDVLGRWASEPAVKSFIAYRKGHKAKALTKTAATRLAANLQKIFNEGGDVDDALGLAEERGWASVEPDWYFKAKGNGNVTGNSNINGTYQRRPGGPNDSMVAAFAFVADRHSHRS